MKNKNKTETATFAAGCFWGVEEAFRHVKGVKGTEVGYTGGKTEHPTYAQVCTDKTGHAEAVRVTYDPNEISYDALLHIFWENHDPTEVNRQGLDEGSQYRSAILYRTEEQKRAAEKSKTELQKSGKLIRPIATEITAAGPFYRAEEYHQQYLEKTGRSTCRS